jgi:CubicO group peptidase (beta-lactamase class C family)
MISRRVLIACLGSLSLTGTVAGAEPVSPGEIAAFIDEFVPQALERLHVPGAVMAVVSPSGPMLLSGYGVADLESARPMDPSETLVRVASISKLMTATAAIQLWERGILDIHADIDRYVASPSARRFAEPLTPHHVLTHTSGFEDRGIGVAVRSGSFPLSLGEYVTHRMPFQASRPGSLLIYTDHGYCLLGHLIEEAAGSPYEKVIRTSILAPLGMDDTRFWHPGLEWKGLAQGYLERTGDLVPVRYGEFVNLPSSQLVTTAADMARFMRAHLSPGNSQNSALLRSEALREMHTRQFTNDPAVAGFAYGFWERFENGHRAIMHDGAILGFSSMLLLLPHADLGIFIAYNRMEPRLHEELVVRLIDAFFPEDGSPGETQALPPRFAPVPDPSGWYVPVRIDRKQLDSLMTRVSAFRVEMKGSSSIRVGQGGGEWLRSGSFELTRVADGGRIALGRDPSGRVTHLFTDRLDGTPLSYRRLAWHESPPFQLALLVSSLGFLLCTSIAVPVLWLRRGGEAVDRAFGSRVIAISAWLTATLSSAFVLLLAVVLSEALEDGGWEFVHGLPSTLRVMLYVPGAALLAYAVLVGATLVVWVSRGPRMALWPLATTAAGAAIFFLLHSWNVLPSPWLA